MVLRYLAPLCCLVFVLSPANAQDDDDSPAEQKRLIPVITVAADIQEFRQSRDQAVRLLGEDHASPDLYGLLDAFFADEDTTKSDGSQRVARLEMYVTQAMPSGELGYGLDIVYPGDKERFLKIVGAQQLEYREIEQDVLLMGGNETCVLGSGFVAIPQIDDEPYGPPQVDRLRKLMADTAMTRYENTLSVSSRPSQIGRSTLKPVIDGIRATLLTQAQRRDDDAEISYLTRTVQRRSLVALLDSFFNDCEELEYSLNYKESERTTDLQLRMTAKKNSAADQFIARFHSVRNRSMLWLHPNHTAFVSLALPLPDVVTETMPKLTAEVALALQTESGLHQNQIVEHIGGKKQFDALLQAIPKEDRIAHVLVLPLESASALESTWINLVSTTAKNGSVVLNVGEVGGWPLHAITEDNASWVDLTGAPDAGLYWVMADDCMAFLVGTEDDVPLFEQIITRNFEPSAQSNRFRNAAFAASSPSMFLHRLGIADVPESVRQRAETDGVSAINDDITVVLHAQPHTLLLTATFEPDAFLSALTTYTASLELLGELLDEIE